MLGVLPAPPVPLVELLGAPPPPDPNVPLPPSGAAPDNAPAPPPPLRAVRPNAVVFYPADPFTPGLVPPAPPAPPNPTTIG